MGNDPAINAVIASARAIEGDYETVAASSTAQVLGATGAVGDYISGLIIVPAALTSVGVVTLLDNAVSIPILGGAGAATLVDFSPIYVPLNLVSVSGSWRITTGASVSVIAIGSFT